MYLDPEACWKRVPAAPAVSLFFRHNRARPKASGRAGAAVALRLMPPGMGSETGAGTGRQALIGAARRRDPVFARTRNQRKHHGPADLMPRALSCGLRSRRKRTVPAESSSPTGPADEQLTYSSPSELSISLSKRITSACALRTSTDPSLQMTNFVVSHNRFPTQSRSPSNAPRSLRPRAPAGRCRRSRRRHRVWSKWFASRAGNRQERCDQLREAIVGAAGTRRVGAYMSLPVAGWAQGA